jgi:TonB family protein
MKNYLTISALSLILVFAQGCGTENKKTETPTDETATTERNVKLEEQRTKLADQRKAELDLLIAETNYYESLEGKIVYYKAEIDPEYVGGTKAMNKFLKDNLKFPDVAEKEQLEGTVYVDFVVSENGDVTEVTASDHTYVAVDNAFKVEALRVVNLMPNWAPGLQNGEAVDVKFSVPITFKLN